MFIDLSSQAVSLGSSRLTGAAPAVVWLSGEHDLATEPELRLILARAIRDDDGGDVVIDLSELDFISVSTLGVLVRAQAYLRRRSRSMTVRAPNARILRTLRICGLEDILGVGVGAQPENEVYIGAIPGPVHSGEPPDLRASSAPTELSAAYQVTSPRITGEHQAVGQLPGSAVARGGP